MDRSRGQIILLAGFALAIIFVSLALILNTAIFTENLATRETADGHDALDLEQAVTETGDVLLRETNRDGGTYSELVGTYRDRIRNYRDAENTHAIARGSIRDVWVMENHNGTTITQTNGTALEDDNETSTWQVTGGTTDARMVRFNITDADAETPFVFMATSDTATWNLSVNKSDGTYTVTIDNGTGDPSTETVDSDTLELQPTNGSIQGDSWPALTFQNELTDPFEIWFVNGSNATGTYQLTVDNSFGTINWDTDNTTVDPAKTHAIYNATLGLELSKPDLEYRANVTIEPEGTDPVP